MISTLKPGIDLRLVDPEDWQLCLENGGSLSDAMSMEKEELEAIYTLAEQYLSDGRYIEAKPLFQLLSYCNHCEVKYLVGLAKSREALEQFELAADTYGFAAFLHTEDASLPFYAAMCHLALDSRKEAKSCFEACVARGVRAGGDSAEGFSAEGVKAEGVKNSSYEDYVMRAKQYLKDLRGASTGPVQHREDGA